MEFDAPMEILIEEIGCSGIIEEKNLQNIFSSLQVIIYILKIKHYNC